MGNVGEHKIDGNFYFGDYLVTCVSLDAENEIRQTESSQSSVRLSKKGRIDRGRFPPYNVTKFGRSGDRFGEYANLVWIYPNLYPKWHKYF